MNALTRPRDASYYDRLAMRGWRAAIARVKVAAAPAGVGRCRRCRDAAGCVPG